MSPSSSHRYVVVVPVKPPAVAKSRLGSLGEEVRRALVVAFAQDTVAAARASSMVTAVLVVTDDHYLAATLRAAGAEVIPDGTADDLNASLVQAGAEAARRWPDCAVAVLCADLPALRSGDLTEALRLAAADRQSFVADAAAVGTTMLVAPDSEQLRPCFGAGSRQQHLATGALEIDAPLSSLRRDVDTPADLEAARALGLGDSTTAVVLATL